MLSTLAVVSLLNAVMGTQNCDDYYECSGETFTDRTNCYGYASCAESSFISDHGLKCDGDRSCYMANMELGEAILCRSTASCEEATMTTDEEVYCEGVQSCANAEVNGAGKVYLYGHYAAVNTKISGVSTVRAYGYYSFLYGTLDSQDLDELQVKLYGVDAGYGANVICRSGSTCSLVCKSGIIYLSYIYRINYIIYKYI